MLPNYIFNCKHFQTLFYQINTQARVQEFARRGAQNLKAFFFFFFWFSIFQGGGPAQKLAEKMTFSTKKVVKYR